MMTYSELIDLKTFEDRFHYLRLTGRVGEPTFGYERWLNQDFYRSREWKSVRSQVIVRDQGCDLGIDGLEIHHGLYVHHMNPMVDEDLLEFNEDILNPEYLITVSHKTHNAIHYGGEIPYRHILERYENDTVPWR